MKKVVRTPYFRKVFQKRIRFHPILYALFYQKLELFLNGDTLKTRPHSLKGNMSGQSAFSITADIRVIYKEEKKLIRLYDVGTHLQVYKRKKYSKI